MGCLGKIILLVITVGFVWFAYCTHKCLQPPTLSAPLPDSWWGPGTPKSHDNSIRPFKISVPENMMQELERRLANPPKLIPSLEDSQFTYGINTEELTNVVNFWKTKYNWKEREAFLNQYPQFKTNIQGLDIHYIHVKPEPSAGVKVLPLLIIFGWPSSVREFYEIIPLLTTVRKGHNFVFEVIAPSLPGYGFSQTTAKKGLGAAEMAVIMKNLMKLIGHEKYYVKGAIVPSHMATMYPDNVIGLYSPFCQIQSPLAQLLTMVGAFVPSLVVDSEHESKMYPFSDRFRFFIQEFGFMHLQATKPDTVGVALTDSPIGLAAYILEKFSTWTDKAYMYRKDGGLTQKFTYTQLLDNVMIYWITNSITSSFRMYAETLSDAQRNLKINEVPTNVPTACAKLPHYHVYQPDFILKLKYNNLVHSIDMPRGGQFATMEEPTLLADDIFIAIEKIENLNKVP